MRGLLTMTTPKDNRLYLPKNAERWKKREKRARIGRRPSKERKSRRPHDDGKDDDLYHDEDDHALRSQPSTAEEEVEDEIRVHE